jgi:hypothetical protein
LHGSGGRRKSYKSAYGKLKQDDFSTNPKTKSNPGAPRFLTWFSGCQARANTCRRREYLPPPRILDRQDTQYLDPAARAAARSSPSVPSRASRRHGKPRLADSSNLLSFAQAIFEVATFFLLQRMRVANILCMLELSQTFPQTLD